MSSFLHIYAQPFWHAPAWIVGDRESLTRLRDALDRAIFSGKTAALEAVVNDGEAYRALVVPAESLDAAELVVPYIDPGFIPAGAHPSALLSRDAYRRAMASFRDTELPPADCPVRLR